MGGKAVRIPTRYVHTWSSTTPIQTLPDAWNELKSWGSVIPMRALSLPYRRIDCLVVAIYRKILATIGLRFFIVLVNSSHKSIDIGSHVRNALLQVGFSVFGSGTIWAIVISIIYDSILGCCPGFR